MLYLNQNGNLVIDAIAHFATRTPSKIAIQGSEDAFSYADLADIIEQITPNYNLAKVLAIALDNSPAWAILDLAALTANLPVVPLPYFFSTEQILHAVNDAGVDELVTDQPDFFEKILGENGKKILRKAEYKLGGKLVTQFTLAVANSSVLPANTAKVTYTSGTTGTPKGVCLDARTIAQVVHSLLQVTNAMPTDRHLSILPLSTLLENIAGLYLPLMAGATTTLLPAAQVGLTGATGLNLSVMTYALTMFQVTTTVLTPELLTALVSAIEANHTKPPHLRYIAVGGASVAPQLLNRAHAVNLPVYEGYGLSECASVVALNTLNRSKLGSVGLPLPHVQIQFAEDGEILVNGACLLGYAREASHTQFIQYWPTGDIGHFDDDGYLYITARKKNQFITSFGRNVAPEWVERELTLSPIIAQAAVFGEARPWNIAVILPAKNVTITDVNESLAKINQTLPDYARVSHWLLAEAPFTPQNGQLTANGRLKRDTIWQEYRDQINRKYTEESHAIL